MRALRIFCLLVLLAASAQAQMKINGVTLPAKLTCDKEELLLNGGGLRKKMLFKVYVAGLYLKSKSKNGQEICQVDRPMAIRLQITSSMVNSKNLAEAVREGFTASMSGKTVPLQDKIDTFIRIFDKEKIKEGDVFDMCYVPASGVMTYKNTKLQGTIAGLDFKKALFGVWISDHSIDDNLRDGLLGI